MHRWNAQVGLIDAVESHRFRVRQAGKGKLDGYAGGLADSLNEGLDHFIDALLLRERHLEIDLGELGLAVSAQVFIAKAAHNLEVLLEAAHHQELLKDLGRLRQCIETARLHAAWYQIVARALGSRSSHEGRFNLKEALRVEEFTRHKSYLRPQNQVPLHVGPPQIHVAILQADVFAHIHLLFHGEGRSTRFVEDPDSGGHHFDGARGQVRIDRRWPPRRDPAFHRNDVLRPHLFGAPVNPRAYILVKHHLGDAVAVTQIHENDAAMVPAAVHPAHEHDGLTLIGGA